jgi:hypothetical protein
MVVGKAFVFNKCAVSSRALPFLAKLSWPEVATKPRAIQYDIT